MSAPPTCELCHTAKPDVANRTMRIISTKLSAGALALGTVSMRSRWIDVACPCCEECHGRAMREAGEPSLGRILLYVALIIIGLPLAGFLLFLPFIGLDKVLPAEQYRWVYATLAVLVLAILFSSPFWIWWLKTRWIRRRMARVFDPALDQAVRDAVGIKSWANNRVVVFLRKSRDESETIPLGVLIGRDPPPKPKPAYGRAAPAAMMPSPRRADAAAGGAAGASAGADCRWYRVPNA